MFVAPGSRGVRETAQWAPEPCDGMCAGEGECVPDIECTENRDCAGGEVCDEGNVRSDPTAGVQTTVRRSVLGLSDAPVLCVDGGLGGTELRRRNVQRWRVFSAVQTRAAGTTVLPNEPGDRCGRMRRPMIARHRSRVECRRATAEPV